MFSGGLLLGGGRLTNLKSALSRCSSITNDVGRLPHLRIARRYQVMLTKLRHGKLTRRVWVEVAGAILTGELLLINFPLQRHEGMDERFGTRWSCMIRPKES